jgi:hypothetical protein
MRYSSALRRIAAVTAGCITCAYAGFFLFIGYFVSVMQCDEGCDGDGWRHTPDAWQWNVFAGLGMTIFAAGCAFVYFIWKCRRGRAAIALTVGLAALVALFAFADPNQSISNSIDFVDWSRPRQVRYTLLGLAAPIAALALARPAREPRREVTGT